MFLVLQKVFNGLPKPPSDIFSKYPMLDLQILYLHSNNIAYYLDLSNRLADVPDGIVDGLLNLDTLDLNRNQISVIRETTFSPATRRRLHRLDLSGNPFLCSCKLRWFRNWLAAESSKFTHSWTSYTCHDRDDLNVTAFVIVPQACLLSQEANIIIIVVITILIVVSTLLSALYHYRWHIRLLLYEAFRGRGDRWRRLEENHFQFDVFVSSASEDFQWVRQHLMPELEERLGLRLCVHERDFIPGKNIVANIEDCVEASKKVLMVFSTNFSRSQWCQFELRLCHHHVTEHDDDLLVVFLEDIPSRDMTSYMMAVMRTTTYIEWADSPEARTAFWGRIQLALHDVMKSSSPSHLIQDRA
nr:hypothetical protein BaRGS_012811 [Batillaria attramentaria]